MQRLPSLIVMVVGLRLSYKKQDEKVDNKNDKPLANILVVDDDSDIAHVLKQGLLQNRFLVSAFTNPEEALKNFQSNSKDYCLMLSDIRCPGCLEYD
jgi:PleD family two-component response regulator